MRQGVLAWWLVAGCSGALRGAGAPDVADRDADGFSVADGDCDDADPAVSPHALDAPSDGADQDCDGADAEAWPLSEVKPGELVISEFLADPVGVEPALGEWIELTNTGRRPLDLEGLVVRDLGRDDFVVSRSLVVAAGRSVVLGGSDRARVNGEVPVDFVWEADYGLSNAEDAIVLTRADDVLDQVGWDADWPQDAGFASTRDPRDGRWCQARVEDVYGIGGRGTPGAPNPGCPPVFDGLTLYDVAVGDLVITELMVDPVAVDGDYGEWIELANTLDEDVDLRGLRVTTDEGDDFEIDRSLVVPADGAVVFGSFLAPQVNGGAPVDWEWRWAFGLRNSGQTVSVFHGTRLLDEVAYDPTFPDVEGASKALDPARLGADDNDRADAWCAGADPYGSGDLGTPGEENPPCP